jgi:hypothetical protein
LLDLISAHAMKQNGQNKVAKMCVRYGADLNAQNVRTPRGLLGAHAAAL